MRVIGRIRDAGMTSVTVALAVILGGCRPDPVPIRSHVPAMTITGGYEVYNDTLTAADAAYMTSIRSLAATTTWETGHARTDIRRLIVGPCAGGSCTVGPLVQIIPASNAHQGSRSTLAAGKLVAKIVTVPNSSGQMAYPKFALDSGGTSYVYIDSSAAHGRWRMIFVPASGTSTQPGRWRETWPHEVSWSKRERSPRAKFLWNDNDDEAWVTCKDMGCCAPPRMMELSAATGEIGP